VLIVYINTFSADSEMLCTKEAIMRVKLFILIILIAFSSYSQTESRVLIDSPEFLHFIQTLESGFWIWETGSCDETRQKFKFDMSKKTMTLSYEPDTKDDAKLNSYSYEILWVWEAGFRSKIIGEERLDSNGVPIEWDLILIDDSSFYWRRNDWAKDYGTKAIIKCP
jgi:hypothetical protein